MMIELTAKVGKGGLVTLQLPPEFEGHEVRITVESIRRTEPSTDEIPWEDQPWTKEEIQELLKFEGKSGAEIAKSDAIGGWAHMGITDSVAFVEELRRREAKRREWPRDESVEEE